MGKIFSKNNLNPEGINIPTAEQNQAEFLDMQSRSQENIDTQTADYLAQEKKKQYGDINIATEDSGLASMEQEFQGMAGTESDIQNQDMSMQPKANNMDDIHRNWLGQTGESFMKGLGDTVIGSTGDVLNFVTAPLPGFSMLEGNVLGNALRDYGDEMADEHTTFLKKKLEGQELTWGSLADADFWSTNVAEMIPMALEFMVTGFGAGAAAKKGMGAFAKALTTEARLARATATAVDVAEGLAGGGKVFKDVMGSGKGLAKYLTRDVDGVLTMSKFSNEFVGAAGAGAANNLLTGAVNGMDAHREMVSQNEQDVANGKAPRYTEKEMADVAAGTFTRNMAYAPIDMISWGLSYGKAGEKIAAGLSKKIVLKPAEEIAKQAAASFTKSTFPLVKGIMGAVKHGVFEGTEETFQETFEDWARLKSKEKHLGEKAPDYFDFYFSKENKNTKVASFAMGALMGGAMNLNFKKASEDALNYADRSEVLRATIDMNDKGGQNAKTYHIRNQMVDLLYDNKVEHFDGFMSSLLTKGTINEEEFENFHQEFQDVSADYEAAASLNVAGKYALAENTIKAKSLTKFIENEHAVYKEKVRVIKEQFGEEDQSLLNEDETARLENLKEQMIANPNDQVDANIKILEKSIKDRSNSVIQKKYAKLAADHEQQIEMMSLNLAQANENRLNLISGKVAKPLNIKFWTNHNGNEMAYITEDGDSSAVMDNTQRELITDPNGTGKKEMTEGQMTMNQERGGIIAGLSDKQYEKFVKMSSDEVFESAKRNHENMLKNASKGVRDGYDKLIGKGKELLAKGKAKLDANGKPVLDEQGNPVMEESTEPNTEAQAVSTEPTNPNAPPSGEQNAYEQAYQDGGLETVAQAEAKKIAEEEAKFKEQKSEVTEEETTDTKEEPIYKPVKDKATGKYSLVDTVTGEAHPNGKTYPTSISAKKDLGNASLVGDVVKGTASLAWKGTKGVVGLAGKGLKYATKTGRTVIKEGGELIEQTQEMIQQKADAMAQQKAIQQNMSQESMRQSIIEKAYYSSPARNIANNPNAPVSKQELDNYLDTKIASFKWGPRAIEEQYTINRILKAKGIDVNVIIAQNLFSLVGAPAVGYALASTIYIDEKVWNQPAIFMHEMSHIHYRLSQNTPATKAVVEFARGDQKLVDKVERLYADKVLYNDGDITLTLEKIFEIFGGKQEVQSVIEELGGLENFLAEFGFTKEPDSEQAVINEELFTHTLQGPMAKNFNQVLEPIRERRRMTVSKGWWSWLKGNSVIFEPMALDVVAKLNKNVAVPPADLFEHVMSNFEKSIAGVNKKAFNAGGFALLVDVQDTAQKENHKRITQAKIEQRRNYNPEEAKAKNRATTYNKIAKKIKADIDLNMKDFSEIERRNALEFQLEELEYSMLEEGAFDDYELAKSVTFRGATRILNSFTKSLNYVKRQRFARADGIASDFNEDDLLDRDALISEFYNLAFETKGNTNAFINAIENSRVEEVYQFNQYMEKMHPGEKMMYLSSMAHVMGNQQTISAIKSVVNADGKWETVNALSETEGHKVQTHMAKLERYENEHYNFKSDENASIPVQNYQYFLDGYENIKNGTQTDEDYLAILRLLAPNGTKFSALINNQTINMKGHNINVKVLIEKMVKSKIAENANGKINVYGLKPFIEAIVDSNRKYTSYSVIQNAEGNMEPSKITNNHLLSEINGMNEFLVKDRKGGFPTFKAFKERYSHLSDASNRTHENPVLRSIYDNAKNDNSRPSVTQYAGLTHLQNGTSSLYKNSTDFTQTIEDFMLFSKYTSKNYVQTLSAMADSPRKFMMAVTRIKHSEAFNKDNELTIKGKRLLESSWNIYDKSNENLTDKQKEGTIKTEAEFLAKFDQSVSKEIARWNENAKDLVANKTIDASYFSQEKLNANGEAKIREFVLNQTVNGMALAEIFNPGIPFNDIVKRNKGNSSPVITFGNKNLKMEAIPIDDSAVKKGSDSGMYMTQAMAQKIVDAGLGVFDLNHGLKLLNYHVERDNPNFKGKSAYFKGYTTIISPETLITEPGLAGIYQLLTEREEKYNGEYFDKYGVSPSLDITNGEHNYINYAVPYSAIKSDFFSAEQKKALSGITYEALQSNLDDHKNKSAGDRETVTEYDKMHTALDGIYYGADGFMGLSTNNFGPQQIMDKLTEEAVTPVQFMSSVIVNGMVGNNLAMGEQIQKLIRADMSNNLDAVISELGNMEPAKYKAFILKNLDLENMDQGQRLMIEESLTNLNHPAISDFITNTLANRLKQSGNKLKTNGSVAQQKPSLHFKYGRGENITINGRSGLAPITDRHNANGSVGTMVNEIVLPGHMKDKIIFRQYLSEQDPQAMRIIKSNPDLMGKFTKATTENNDKAKSDVMKEVALMIARARHGKARPDGSYGHSVNDYIGEYYKDGVIAGWFVRGENVMATRIPSHGPASTGVFEAVDYLEGEGNQTIVSEDFSDTAGSDYDGDSLFIQRKGKETPNFNEALAKTVDLWTSPGMRMQIKAKIEFEKQVEKVIGKNKKQEKQMPMSPSYHREAYNNTMISKRNIGIIFNTHRIANYLAAYNVKINSPINIDGTRVDTFSDKEVGQESRNNQSAMLANIILDNAKYGFADALGLNDQTINQYSLLTNMGFSLQQVNDIMNSKAVKVWNKHQANNSNPYATKMKNADVKKAIFAELGIQDSKVDKISITTDPLQINTREQMKHIIHMMETLETMNADILHVSKIMAGHKGIENNPFILEQQLADFDAVVNSDKENALLTFPEAFRQNPDISAYHDNASKILEVMKKANNIYSKSTSELITSLNEKIGFDGKMNGTQMERASDIIKRFHTSRILGLNNLSATEKNNIKKKVFKDILAYEERLKESKLPGNRKLTAHDKSILFNRALNMNIRFNEGQKNVMTSKKTFDEKSYISANPRFFNESLTEEDRIAVQQEFKALPQTIKDGLLTLDLMKNGLTGKLSLSIIFDEGTNQDISDNAAYDSKHKNNAVNKSVMDKLENLIISNEFNTSSSVQNATNSVSYKTGDNLLSYIKANNIALANSLNRGAAMIFKVDGQPYIYGGISKEEKAQIRKEYGNSSLHNEVLSKAMFSKIKPYKAFAGDINLEAISIADNDAKDPYKTRPSEQSSKHMTEATEAFNVPQKKKSDLGNASLIDFHNYNDVTPLNQREFNVVMEYEPNINDEQKELVYKSYLEDKKQANDLMATYNQESFSKMTDDALSKAYGQFAQKDMYAYSVITTPLVMELANRMGVEQSELTDRFEDGKDISLMDSWLNNNNIASNHPVTQNLVKKLGEEYKKFVVERGKYIKNINVATDALYKEKFELSSNKYVRLGQRVVQSLIKNRNDVYQKLYGNLIETEEIIDANGTTKKTLKFKTEEQINAMRSAGKITKAEFDFYTTFRETTKHLKKYDSNDKTRKDYIPHTAMGNFEQFANRGLLGLLVNSKGIDAVTEDVKVYAVFDGKEQLMTFRDVKNNYNALALSGKQTTKDLVAFNKLKTTARKLQKTGKNEDGSRLIYSNMQNETLMAMSPLSRFESSRSNTAELMPSMDLNKALVEYVHASMFTNGNENFKGFKAMMPMIDGVMAYNDKNGYQNAYKYVKEVIKEGFIMKKEQITFGKNTDAVINGLVKSNTLYALGYKGLLIGKGIYAIGNLAVGKYMNIKREGGKSWLIGEARYWGVDKGISLETLSRRRRARNILSNLGYMEADFYDDVSMESKSGLDHVFTELALAPMAVTEDWIQRTHLLGMLTDEEYNKFDEVGNYKTGETQITPERFQALEERVKNSHGKGFSPTDQSRIHRYALGKMFMQFSRHIPTQIRERFSKEDIDMNGQKYIGSLRQIGKTAVDIFNNRMTPKKFKEYYASLEPHQREALLSGMRGMALMTTLGMIAGHNTDASQMTSGTDVSSIASGVQSDANVHFDLDRLGLKTIPPSVRSAMSVLKIITHGGHDPKE